MARTFSLQAVLQLRQHKEEAEERALAALGAQRQRVETTLARVRHELTQWTETRTCDVGHTHSGHAQHTSYARLHVLQDAQAQLLQQLQQLEAQRTQQQANYLAARSAREMLTELRTQQAATHEAADQRREQQRSEDLFLGRWSR